MEPDAYFEVLDVVMVSHETSTLIINGLHNTKMHISQTVISFKLFHSNFFLCPSVIYLEFDEIYLGYRT